MVRFVLHFCVLICVSNFVSVCFSTPGITIFQSLHWRSRSCTLTFHCWVFAYGLRWNIWVRFSFLLFITCCLIHTHIYNISRCSIGVPSKWWIAGSFSIVNGLFGRLCHGNLSSVSCSLFDTWHFICALNVESGGILCVWNFVSWALPFVAGL